MRIHSSDVICGLPALEFRRLLRLVDWYDGFDLERVRDVHPMSKRAAARLIDELTAAGYVESKAPHRPGVPLWRVTVHGRAVILASAARPIRRATADRLLGELLDRIDAVSADEGLQYRVSEAVVFGSYLSDAPTLGDVDIGIRLESRLGPDDDPVEHGRARVELARENGRIFYSWKDELFWSSTEVWLRLKARARGLSLHDMHADHLFEHAELQRRVIYANGRRVSLAGSMAPVPAGA